MVGVECLSGYWDEGVLNPFMESKWPVSLSVAVFDQEQRFVRFLIPPKPGAKEIPERGAWTFLASQSRVGTRIHIPDMVDGAQAAPIPPGVYFLQAICTERMFRRRPWSAHDNYSKEYRRRWLTFGLDRECCRSELVKLVVLPNKPARTHDVEVIRSMLQQGRLIYKSPLNCQITKSGKPRITVGDDLHIDMSVENVSNREMFLKDVLLEVINGSYPDLQMMVWNDNGDVLGDLNDRRRISYTTLGVKRLPPGGWVGRNSILWHKWVWPGEFTLQVIYGPNTFATPRQYANQLRTEAEFQDGKQLASSPADALRPEPNDVKAEFQQYRLQSNPLRFSVEPTP